MSTTQQQRISFSTIKNRVPYPDLLEIQLKSFRDFFQLDTTAENRKNEGLYKVFNENFPITDTRNNFVLEFIDYYIDQPRYTIEECLELETWISSWSRRATPEATTLRTRVRTEKKLQSLSSTQIQAMWSTM